MAQGSGGAVGVAAWGVGLAVVAAVFAGGLYMSGIFAPPEMPETTPISAASQETAPTSEAASSQQAATDDVPVVEPEPVVELSPPEIDVVRVEPDGSTVIAGKAVPGSRISILLDGTEQEVVQAGVDGAFVSLLTLPAADGPRVLTFLAQLGDESATSEDQIILAPSISPEANTDPEKTVSATDAIAETEEGQENQISSGETEQAEANMSDMSVSDQPDPESSAQVASGQDGDAEVSIAELAADPTIPSVPQSAPEPETKIEEGDADGPSLPSEVVAAGQDIGENEPELESPPQSDAKTMTDAKEIKELEVAKLDPDAPAGLQTSGPEPMSVPVAPEVAIPTEAPSDPVKEPEPEPGSVTVLRAGADGVELVQPAISEQPSAMARIVLDTISYSGSGEVLLSGRAQGESVVRIYLDNTPVTDFGVNRDGRWKGRLDGVQPGVYTLRLDELNDKGEVLSRLETPFKREAPEVLQPPVSETLAETPLIRAVTVQTGDTLWAISRDRYGDGVLYVRVFEANKESIKNPDLIYPGQVFTIPE